MAVNWTKEQEQVINLRNRNILVSAAAGSGKTAVLVQRILKKVMDPEHPVDIDRLLIMTFTRAAAGEMRERIANALEDALCENPDNEHLQRQTTLIHTAQITTIDDINDENRRQNNHGHRLCHHQDRIKSPADHWKTVHKDPQRQGQDQGNDHASQGLCHCYPGMQCQHRQFLDQGFRHLDRRRQHI